MHALPRSWRRLSCCNPMFSHGSILLPVLQVSGPRLSLPHPGPFRSAPLAVLDLPCWELTYSHNTPPPRNAQTHTVQLLSSLPVPTRVNGGNRRRTSLPTANQLQKEASCLCSAAASVCPSLDRATAVLVSSELAGRQSPIAIR